MTNENIDKANDFAREYPNHVMQLSLQADSPVEAEGDIASEPQEWTADNWRWLILKETGKL